MKISSFKELGREIEKLTDSKAFQFSRIIEVLSKLTPRDITALLNSMLCELKDLGRLPTIEEDHIYLYRQKEFSLLLRFAGSGTVLPQLCAHEFDAFILNLSNFPIEIPVYKTLININDLAQRPLALEPQKKLLLPPYGLHSELAFCSILDFHSASKNVPLLIIHSERRAWSTWVFDRKTLQPDRRVATDLRASRIQLALKLLMAMQVTKVEEILKDIILSNYADFVRWDAVEHLCQINQDIGVEVIKQLSLSDTSPGIQRAAQATLLNLK